MKFQVNLQALEYWYNMIKWVYIFYEVIIKSQIVSKKFIKKIWEVLQPMKFTIFYIGKQLSTWISLFGSHVGNIEYHVGKYFFKSNWLY